MKKRIWNNSIFICALSALISIVFCAVVWAFLGFYPGSYRTLLNSDMESQYVSFFESLRSVISGENSIFYNWSLYFGNNYLGHYAYYLASPWSWFLLLWKTKELPTAIYFMSLIKIGLCGLTFSIFLLKRPIRTFVSSNNEKMKSVGIISFSVIYALMSYNMLYVICPMWIDAVYMLPLVILGLERIIAYKKSLLYFVSFTLLILFNFYTGYMVAIFTILYFAYYIFYCRSYNAVVNKENNQKTINISVKSVVLYIVTSLMAVGSSMVILLPTVYCLGQGKLEHDTKYFLEAFTYPIWQILFRFFDSSYTSITNEGLPSLFCTSFCVLFALFFIVKGLKKSAKISAISIWVFMILSLWIAPLNRIWTGFKDPIWFPFRYAFLISFFVILLGYEGFITFIDLKINIKSGKKIQIKRYIYILWVALTVFELYLCVSLPRFGLIREIGSANTTLWNAVFETYEPLIDKTESIEATDANSTGFYRMDKDEFFTFNDAMLLSYNGVQSFSSMYNKKPLLFMKKLGLKQDDYELYEKGSTVISDSIVGVKYYMDYDADEEFYNKVGQNYMTNLYQNEYALSLGYMIEGGENDIEWTDNVFINQNQVLSLLTGDDVEAFYFLDYEESIISYDEVKTSITADSTRPTELGYELAVNKSIDVAVASDGHVYLYCAYETGHRNQISNIYNSFKQYYVNGQFFEAIQLGRYSYLMDLGCFEEGQKLNIIVTNCTNAAKLYVAQMNVDIVKNALTQLDNNAQVEDIEIQNGNMSAMINADNSGRVFMSVPYDKGWTLYVDGKEETIEPIFDTFCSFEITEGEHTIEMKYVSPYFREGLIISCICLIFYIGGCVFVSFRRKKYEKN